MFDPTIDTKDYISIVVTHECNRNCPFCIDRNRGKVEFIMLSDVKKALRFAKEKNIKDILLVGGEPTLHKDIVQIAKICQKEGLNVVLTSNFDNLEKIYELDPYVDSFNMSWYGQSLPDFSRINHADLTLSALIYKGQLDTKEKLDAFIDEYEHYPIDLKFSTLSIGNEFAKLNQKVDYLDRLPGDHMLLFKEILGQRYRGYIIKRYDRIMNPFAEQSYKCHTDGSISKSW